MTNLELLKQKIYKEILVKEPMLNDVLLWLNKSRKDTDILSIMRFTATFRWDLSKPYLKDQSLELIDSLNTL